MASYLFHIGALRGLQNLVDWETTTIKAMLVMSNYSGATAGVGDATLNQTTASKQIRDVANMTEIETIDQCDASSGYNSTGGTALTSPTVSIDTTNHWIIYDTTTNITFTGLDGSTRDVVGAIIYEYGATTGEGATSFPIAFLDAADFDDNGSDVTIEFNANGIGRIQFS